MKMWFSVLSVSSVVALSFIDPATFPATTLTRLTGSSDKVIFFIDAIQSDCHGRIRLGEFNGISPFIEKTEDPILPGRPSPGQDFHRLPPVKLVADIETCPAALFA